MYCELPWRPAAMNDFMLGSLSAVVSVANEGQWGEGGKARQLITSSPLHDSVSWSIVRLCTPMGAGRSAPVPMHCIIGTVMFHCRGASCSLNTVCGAF